MAIILGLNTVLFSCYIEMIQLVLKRLNRDYIIKPGLENNFSYIKLNFAKLTSATEKL